jgi:serine beta-lactamase-like protein LACTB
MHVISPRRWPGVVLGVAFLFALPGAVPAQESVPAAKKYEEVAKRLEAMITREVKDKGLPALSIALVDDQTVVWAKGFGHADPEKKTPATAETVYRVGSVSKLFTDLAVMQLVERGTLDLDEPITKYLPDFKPTNTFDKPITLRQLMAHRSGLVREPPEGNYFDPNEPSLAKTIKSLNNTELLFAPGAKMQYSNAGIATVGFVLEETQKQPFARYLARTLLAQFGMKKSSFEPDPAITKDLARGVMWNYHGRDFPAPTFQLGEAPAGTMYSTVNDLGRFVSVLFAKGKGPDGVVLKPETLEAMWKPQFVKEGEKNGFGLGFSISQFENRRRIGHGGAIYGFSTALSALPEDKLGVVVAASRDVVNPVTDRIAETALQLMLAAKENKPLPTIEETKPLTRERAHKLAGRYKSGEKTLDLVEHDGHLWAFPMRGGFRVELRAQGDNLIVDDRLGYGTRIEVAGDKLKLGKDEFAPIKWEKPAAAPVKWRGLIGEYGWDHNTLYILERDGQLYALIEWFFLYPLKELKENEFQFPDFGLYPNEKLIFTRNKDGRATQVNAANVVFERRKLDGEDGSTFRIKPQRPIDELRKEALAAKPPEEKGDFRKSELVDLAPLDRTIKLDIRYATDNNFLSSPLYTSARAYMQKPAAEALVRAHKKLAEQGYGLLIFDAYRPWHVTKIFWEATPAKLRHFVANPAEGSRHNRGCAVDLTLYDLKTGKPIDMVGVFDEMSDRSYPDYLGGTSWRRWHRDLLRRTMEDEGFSVYEAEWWHFDYKDWRQYRIGTATFEEVEKELKGKED